MMRLGLLMCAVFLCTQIESIQGQCATNGTECTRDDLDEHLTLTPPEACYANDTTVTALCNGQSVELACENGTWNSTTCDAQCTISAVPNSNNNDGRNITHASNFTIECEAGYSFEQKTEFLVTCNDGTLDGDVPTQCFAQCTISAVPNSNNNDGRNITHASNFTIECEDGYSFEESTQFPVTCNDGTLDGTVPTECSAGTSAPCTIAAVNNSNVAEGTTIEDNASFIIECNEGYSYEQSTRFEVTCTDGNLDGTEPTKCFLDCAALTPPINGSVTGGFLHNETMYYSCNRGFLLNDTVTEATCNDGVWSTDGVPPTCYDLRLGDQISLNCTSGFFVVAIPLLLFDEDTAGVGSVNMGGCQGTSADNDFVYINSAYTNCQTSIRVDGTNQQVIYENQVVNNDNSGSLVTTDSAILIDILCAFDQNELVSSYAVMQNVLKQQRDGKSEFNLIFNVFADAGYTNNIAGIYIETNSDIFIKAQVVDVFDLDVFPTSCYATPVESANMTLSYQLITNGTSDDPEFAKNLRDADIDGKPSFSFESKAFRFSNSSSQEIYIHCWLKICPDNECPLSGSVAARRRRSVRDTPLTVTKYVKAGPIKVREPRATEDATGTTGSSWQMTTMMVYSATLSLVAVCAIGIMGVIVYRRRPITDGYGRI